METLELSRAELWFCAPDVPACDEAEVFLLRLPEGECRVRARLVPSRLTALEIGRPAFELFVQQESERGLGVVLRCEGTSFWRTEERANKELWQERLEKAWAKRMARVWRPDTDDRFAVGFSSNGQGRGNVLGPVGDPPHFCNTSFVEVHSRAFQEFLLWPQHEFESFCFLRFDDNSSPLRRAYEWHAGTKRSALPGSRAAKTGLGARCALWRDAF